jgi:hypothetical protein
VQFVRGHLTGVQSVFSVQSVLCTGTVYADIGSASTNTRALAGRTECAVCTRRRNLFLLTRMRVARVKKKPTVQLYKLSNLLNLIA